MKEIGNISLFLSQSTEYKQYFFNEFKFACAVFELLALFALYLYISRILMRKNKLQFNQHIFIKLPLIAFILILSSCSNTHWSEASREPAGIATDPSTQEAVIEFYAADAFSWRGWFAVHTWFALKSQNEDEYTVYEVVGWGVENGRPAIRSFKTKTPDRYWYGSKPDKFLSITGSKADVLIPQILAAIDKYPHKNTYTLVPGPNSNTFPAWIGLQVPELELDMPFRAIGSGYANE